MTTSTRVVAADRPLAGRSLPLDALRGLAALLVLANHTRVPWQDLPAWTAPARLAAASGGTGVALFLVVSGFSIASRWSTTGPFPVRRFWARRFRRLYPTFWAAALLSVALLCLAEGPSAVLARDRPWVWRPGEVPVALQVLGTATVVTANVVPLAHLVRAWSLALEEQLYALWTLVQVRAPRLTSGRVLVAAVVLHVLWQGAAALVLPRSGDLLRGGGDPRLLLWQFQVPALLAAWAAGWWLSDLRARGWAPAHPGALAATAAAALLAGALVQDRVGPVVALPGPRTLAPATLVVGLLFALGYAALLAAAVLRPAGAPGAARPTRGRAVRALAGVGVSAYSLYLVHPPVLELVDRRTSLPLGARLLLGWAAALATARVFWLLVERRWTRPGRAA